MHNRLNQVGSTRYLANFNARGERVLKSVNGVAVRAGESYSAMQRPLQISGSGNPNEKPDPNASNGEKPCAEKDCPADPSDWTDDKEQAWIRAVAGDWVNAGLTATVYDEDGQVLSYRRSGTSITHEEMVWFGNTPIARFTSSGSTI